MCAAGGGVPNCKTGGSAECAKRLVYGGVRTARGRLYPQTVRGRRGRQGGKLGGGLDPPNCVVLWSVVVGRVDKGQGRKPNPSMYLCVGKRGGSA